MKILSIGNSFSQDAQKWLHDLAEINGYDFYNVNLNIGGCDLATHWNNVVNNNPFYYFEENGNDGTVQISILDGLKLKEWDIITVQQVSQSSGMEETYLPYLENLLGFIKEHCPKAQLYLHQTWAYEIDTGHGGFLNYNKDQDTMCNAIISATKNLAQKYNLKILPVGTVIQKIRREVPEFDYANGGLSLCRDSFHLSLDYGRYTAASVWLSTFIEKPLKVCPFKDFDFSKTEKIVSIVNESCNKTNCIKNTKL